MQQAERVALNLMQRMSGIATMTAKYVTAAAGTEAHIVDTRKTTPERRCWNAMLCDTAERITIDLRCLTR